MGSVYRRTRRTGSRKGRKGRKGKADNYTIKYKGPDGKWKTETAFSDIDASRALLAQREREVARGEVGLVDKYADHKTTPLTEHLEDFTESVTAGGATAKYVARLKARLTLAFEAMDVHHYPGIDAGRIERLMVYLRDNKRASATVNHYLDALREFARWGVERERWPRDFTASVKKITGKRDVKRKRRALTVAELEKLLTATKTRARDNYLETHPKAPARRLARLLRQGEARVVAYRLAALAGLRFNEIKTLTWADVDFDKAPARITIRAKHAKSKREDSIPISEALADALLTWRDARAEELGRDLKPTDRVVNVGSRFRDSLRADLKAAGIDEKDASDRYVDMHALRHTYATMLARNGAHPQVAQKLLRHADIRTTMAIYTHTDAEDQAKAVAALPTLDGTPKATEAPENATEKADETDGPENACTKYAPNNRHLTTRENTELHQLANGEAL